jgi:hypothetical protein
MTEPVSEFKPGDRVIVRGTLVEVGNPRPSPWLYFSPDKDHVEWSVLPASVEPEPYVPTVGERVVSVRADQYVWAVIEVGPTVKVRWRPGGSVTSPRVVDLGALVWTAATLTVLTAYVVTGYGSLIFPLAMFGALGIISWFFALGAYRSRRFRETDAWLRSLHKSVWEQPRHFDVLSEVELVDWATRGWF